jgi:hypothetical protein
MMMGRYATPPAGNDQDALYRWSKSAPAVHSKGPDPRMLHFQDIDAHLGHWPVSMLMNGYSLFIAQTQTLKKVRLPWGPGARDVRASGGRSCRQRVEQQ